MKAKSKSAKRVIAVLASSTVLGVGHISLALACMDPFIHHGNDDLTGNACLTAPDTRQVISGDPHPHEPWNPRDPWDVAMFQYPDVIPSPYEPWRHANVPSMASVPGIPPRRMASDLQDNDLKAVFHDPREVDTDPVQSFGSMSEKAVLVARFGYPRPGNPGMPPRRMASVLQDTLSVAVFHDPREVDTDPVQSFGSMSEKAVLVARFGYPRPGNPGMPPRRMASVLQDTLSVAVFHDPREVDTDPVQSFGSMSEKAVLVARFGYPRPGNPGMPPRRMASELQDTLSVAVFHDPRDVDTVPAELHQVVYGWGSSWKPSPWNPTDWEDFNPQAYFVDGWPWQDYPHDYR